MSAPIEVTTTDWTDRVLDLDVGPVAHGGHCVARVPGDDGPDHDGRSRVLFVRHALPGERVRAVVTEDRGGFGRADTIAVLAAAPGRVEAPCSWARAGGCGGCDWQHADAGVQRDLKTAVLREQLERLGGLSAGVLDELAPVVEELPRQEGSSGLLGWRHRVRLAVDGEGRAGLRAQRSHDVLPIADCPLTPPGTLPPVLAQRFRPHADVEVVVDADGTRHVLRGAAGRPDAAIVQRAAGREWRLTPGTFWQVHPALADALAQVVGEWGQAPPGGVAWDLYGGVGLFAAVLAEQVGPGGRVTVVESASQAVADGRAALADLPQVRWRTGRVEHVLPTLASPTPSDHRDTRPDVVVADPPRRGLGRALVTALCAHQPARVVHLACDPAALARDVALFASCGYRLAALRAFDAFPMTHHLEATALLVPA